jgi:hypothetical protein
VDEGTPPGLSLALDVEFPFGDARSLGAAVDEFLAGDGRLAARRAEFSRLALSLLASLGEGPGKPAPPARSVRQCPAGQVAAQWRSAQAILQQFFREGAELQQIFQRIARHDELGESLFLLPNQRARVAEAKKAHALMTADVRELTALWERGVERELRYRGCSDALLAAALASPERVRQASAPPEPPAPPPRRLPLHRRASFIVDNRSCPDPVSVFVDGDEIGAVPGATRATLTADAGRRTLCLLARGQARCGERGTIRQVYLHEGWEVALRCPSPAGAIRPTAP